MTLKETVKLAFTGATPDNINDVFMARFALLGVVMIVFIMTFFIVLLIGPQL